MTNLPSSSSLLFVGTTTITAILAGRNRIPPPDVAASAPSPLPFPPLHHPPSVISIVVCIEIMLGVVDANGGFEGRRVMVRMGESKMTGEDEQ